MTSHRLTCLPALLLIAALAGSPLTAAEPAPVTTANYKQALKYSSEFLRQFVYDTSVSPTFLGKTDRFWYSFRTSQGTRWWLVNPEARSRVALFDHDRVAQKLSELTQKPVDAGRLPLTRVSVDEAGAKMKFVTEEFEYEVVLANSQLTKLGKAPPPSTAPGFGGRGGRGGRGGEMTEERRRQLEELMRRQQEQQEQQQDQQQEQRREEGDKPRTTVPQADPRVISPDKKAYLYAQKHNLFLVEDGKDKEPIQLTKDGVEGYSFGGGNDDRRARPTAIWSPDSKAFTVTRSDSRGVKDLFLVNSLTEPRPTLETYKYPMPGEEAIRKTELYIGDRASRKVTRVTPKWKDEGYSDLKWGKTSEDLRFVRRDRLLRHLEVCRMNPQKSEIKCLIADGFENAYLEFQPVRDIEETGEMLWWSERSGWGHYYLYDREGKLKNAVTSGPHRASLIVALDPARRLLYYRGNGREAHENVYYQHLYCVSLDGGEPRLMDPGCGTHQSTLSPSRTYVIDNCSRLDAAPCVCLRDEEGRELMELERADLSRLTEVGWKLPETFTVKAADGVTELYGNLWKPFDFDPNRKYPIIAHVYPGPQQEGVTHTFSAVSTNQQLAQLGFIVVQVGHRGGAPTRSKAYHSFSYWNMRDYGLADKKSAIEQLAARHPWIDVERVGIFGHSGGGFMSAAALLQKPYNEFFKAAVASAGNHDNNIYNNSWAERYHGLKEVPVTAEGTKAATGGTQQQRGTGTGTGGRSGRRPPEQDTEQEKAKQDQVKKEQEKKEEKKSDGATTKAAPPAMKWEIKVPTNAELAANLKGHLLLVHGDMDNNVHPANTMRLVDALIKANKRFDMLILPGKRHGFADAQPYFTQRMWDFFVEHLHGEKPTGADIFDKSTRKR